MDLSHQRKEYSPPSLEIESANDCPFKQFELWFQHSVEQQVVEPNAMTLATVSGGGHPTQRTVLLKFFDENGFVFFTSYSSRKAKHIQRNSNVSISFVWLDLHRQIEINGSAEKVSKLESLRYFALRPRGSQLGAWVSSQSSVVSAKSVLMNKFAKFSQLFHGGSVPKPPSWGGYRVRPERFEFWQGGRDRLHDRIEYQYDSAKEAWSKCRLAP